MNIKTGTFTSASGAAETVALGFEPDYVIVMNQNAATGEIGKVEWFGSAMGDAKEFHTTLIADDGTTSNVNQGYVASGGNIISTTGSTPSVSGETLSFSGSEGFTVATGFVDTSDVVWYLAIQSD